MYSTIVGALQELFLKQPDGQLSPGTEEEGGHLGLMWKAPAMDKEQEPGNLHLQRIHSRCYWCHSRVGARYQGGGLSSQDTRE